LKGDNIGVKISKAEIMRVYSSLNISESVLEQIYKAHSLTLHHGLTTNTERAIGIDSVTGTKETDEVGNKNTVALKVRSGYAGKMIVVHNHPKSTPFSYLDLHTFGSIECIRSNLASHMGRVTGRPNA
jgi:uncharacterized protein (UPF0210 family)